MSTTLQKFPPVNEQLDEIRRNASEIVPEDDLVRKLERSLRTGTPLIVKQGFDPTRPDLHIGHAVSIRKLRQFQELGHQVVFVVGDYTARIGDPTGRSETRPKLSPEEIDSNARTYAEQVSRILDVKRVRIEYNSQWLAPLQLADILELTSNYTVARMLERDDFAKRFAENRSIAVSEFMYPLMQAYDSVALKADVELGGTDQKFNLLVARTIQERYGQEPQVCLIMPLMRGTDGEAKMSKSYDNYVGIAEPADQQYGKTMSIPDALLEEWARLTGFSGSLDDPYRAKRALARHVVATYHGTDAGATAEAEFDRVFRQRDVPEEMPEATVSLTDASVKYDADGVRALDLIALTGLVASRSDGARQLEQGAVSYRTQQDADWVTLREREARIPAAAGASVILKKGKRHFVRVHFNG